MWLGEWLPTFRRKVGASCSREKQSKMTEMLDPSYEMSETADPTIVTYPFRVNPHKQRCENLRSWKLR